MQVVVAIDDGHPMTIPAAWRAWQRHGIQYWRLRRDGLIYAQHAGRFVSYVFDEDGQRWLEAVVGNERGPD